MRILEILFCIICPPLAVLDRGWKNLLFVIALTLCGWIPGVWAAIIIRTRRKPNTSEFILKSGKV